MSRRSRIPPNPDVGLESEFHCVGALLLGDGRGDAYDRLADIVSSDDFQNPNARAIWQAAEAMVRDGLPLDRGLVAEHIASAGLMSMEDAAELCCDVAEYVATAVNIEHHGRVVREYADMRALVATCNEAIAKARSSGWQSAREVIDEAIEALMSRFEHKTAGQLVSLKSAAAKVIAEVRALHESEQVQETVGVPCGIRSVDLRLRGFRPGHLYIVGARPAMGKTAVGVAWAVGAAQAGGVTVLYVSAEIPARDIAVRVFGAFSGVNTEVLETADFGRNADAVMDSLATASVRVAAVGERLQILDMPDATLTAIRSAVRRIKRRRDIPPLGLVVVDYLQIIKPARDRDNREREVAEVSGGLRQLARLEQLPVIALSQLNRECEKRADKRPTMADIRESGSIEQDASVIVCLYRDEVYNENTSDKGIIEGIIVKNRLGKTGKVRMAFDKTCQRIADLESRYADDHE